MYCGVNASFASNLLLLIFILLNSETRNSGKNLKNLRKSAQSADELFLLLNLETRKPR